MILLYCYDWLVQLAQVDIRITNQISLKHDNLAITFKQYLQNCHGWTNPSVRYRRFYKSLLCYKTGDHRPVIIVSIDHANTN